MSAASVSAAATTTSTATTTTTTTRPSSSSSSAERGEGKGLRREEEAAAARLGPTMSGEEEAAELTIAEDVVVNKYKMGGEIANRECGPALREAGTVALGWKGVPGLSGERRNPGRTSGGGWRG